MVENKIKPGYKQTEVGIIPEDWEIKKIRDVCTLINGRGFKPHEWKSKGIPIIRIQNLNGSEEFNYFSGNYNTKIEVKSGQLLFAWSGSKGTSFGPHIWNRPLGLLNYHTWKVDIDKNNIDKDYFFHALKSLTKFIESNAHGASALVHTQKWEMEGFLLQLPPEQKEQSAIAESLNSIDELIESLDKLIEKKKMIKHGAMQELLAGEKRLPGYSKVWEEKELGDFSKVFSGSSAPQGENYYINGIYPFVRVSDLSVSRRTNHLISVHDYLNKYCIVSKNCVKAKKGTILFPKSGAAVQNNNRAQLGIDAFVVSHLAAIFSEEVSNRFLYYKLSQIDMMDYVGDKGYPSLKVSQIKKIILTIPSDQKEQTAIANVLSDMDEEIELLEKKRHKYKLLKLGMMQELLTGRIRLHGNATRNN